MPRRTNPFQGLVTLIQHAMSGTDIRVESPAMIPDTHTSKQREVDILVSGELAGIQLTVALECRDHKDPQDITWIDDLIGKYRDLPVDKVIAVSSSGFTGPAIDKAKAVNIETLTIEEAQNVDWPDLLAGFKTITIHSLFVSKLSRVTVVFASEKEVEVPKESLLQARVIDRSRGDIGNVLHLARENLKGERFLQALEAKAPSESRTSFRAHLDCRPIRFDVLLPDGRSFPLAEILLEGECSRGTTVISLRQLLRGSVPVAYGRTTVSEHDIDMAVAPIDETKQLGIAVGFKKRK